MIIDSGIVTGSLLVQGPLTVSGSLSVTDGITGSLQGTASYALSALTASYLLGQSPTSSYALTASYADNFTVQGTLTAQTIVAQTITSSTEFITGSTRNGSLLSNTHQFTGSVGITGSVSMSGDLVFSPSNTYQIGSPTLYPTVITTSTSRAAIFRPLLVTGFQYRSFDNINVIGQWFNNGNLVIQSGSALTDNGYRLQVNGASASGSLFVSGSSLFSGSVRSTNGFTGSLLGTASYATQAVSASYWSGSITNAESASYALTSSYSNNATSASYATNALSASYWSGSIENAATASYVLNAVSASYATNALTASYASNVPVTASYALTANTASYALTASYISGSGAGVGFPFSGSAIITGSLYVSSSFISGSFKGDGSQITGLTAGGKIHTQSSAASTWTFTHNLGVQYPNVTVYNASNEIILPQTITATDDNTLVLTFGASVAGYAVAGIGGIINVQGRTTQQYFTSATTWSFAHNLGDKYVSIQAFDDAFEMMIPSTIRLVDYTSSVLLFESASSGYAVATIGGDLPAISSSYAGYTLQVASSAPYSASWVAVPNVTVTNAVTASYLNPITNSFIVLSQVSSSLNFVDDTAAAAGGVPLGGLYRSGNFILIRLV